MGLVKDAVGVVVSAACTGGLFLGPAIVGILLAIRPIDTIDTLTTPERVASVEGAWVQGPVEISGDLDGTSKAEDAPTEDPPVDPEQEPEPEGTPDDATGPEDPKSKADSVGGDVTAKPTSKAGTRAGEVRGSDSTRRPASAAPADNGRKQAESKRKCAPSYEGIRRRADGTFELDRDLVTYHTSSVKRFNELGYSHPNDKGDGNGWFISGFGCNDALWHGGFRRGDVVLTVNGKKTNNMMQIFLLYSKVKAQKTFEVEILRKGRPVTLRYEIVKG